MTYYCVACRRATDAYDLWPNGECVCCYTATEDVMARDAIYNPVFAYWPIPSFKRAHV